MDLFDSLFASPDPLLEKANPHHDARGRFASGPGSAAAAGRRAANVAKAEEAFADASEADKAIIMRPSSSYKAHNAEGRDTEELFKDGPPGGATGKWTPERQELHEAIMRTVLKDAKPTENPTFSMMGGGPASGKSSVEKHGQIKQPPDSAHIDADKIKSMLPEYREGLGKGDESAAARAHEESSYLTKMAIDRAVAMSSNAHWDGTGDSGYEKLKGRIEKIKATHKVVANYMTLDTNLALKIQEIRAKETGRKVSEGVVRNTHKAVSQVLPKALEDGLFDEVTLWDNNIKDHPRKVLTGQKKSVTIHDNDLWLAFLAKANE